MVSGMVINQGAQHELGIYDWMSGLGPKLGRYTDICGQGLGRQEPRA